MSVSITKAGDPEKAVDNPKDLEKKLGGMQRAKAKKISDDARHNMEAIGLIIDMEDSKKISIGC